MGAEFTLAVMGLAFPALIALLVVFARQQYARNEPIRAAAIAHIPAKNFERRARNYRIASGIALCLYGLLKIGAHTSVVLWNGLEGFSKVGNVVSSSPQGDLFAYVATLSLGATMLAVGIWILRPSFVGLWASTGIIGFDTLLSLAIGLGRFGDSRVQGGMVLVMLVMLIPATVGCLVILALQNHLLGQQKRKMDEVAIRASQQ